MCGASQLTRPNIVICGYPRSGSTMFFNMLRSTVQGYNFTDKECSAYFALRESPWPLITKYPSDCFYADEILDIDPKAKFIVMIRDPRSVLCSKHKTTGDLYKVSWNKTVFGNPALTGLQKRNRDRYQNTSPGRYRSKWGLLDWDAVIDLVPNPYILRYEQLVTALPQVQATLGKRFGFEYAGNFADFYKTEIPDKLSYQLNGA